MAREQGLSAGQVRKDMGLGDTSVRGWLKQYDAELLGQPGLGKPLTAEQQCIRQLSAYLAGGGESVEPGLRARCGESGVGNLYPQACGGLYLAAVLDLYSRQIVGCAMAPAMPASLVCTALQIAFAQRQPSGWSQSCLDKHGFSPQKGKSTLVPPYVNAGDAQNTIR